MLAEDERLMVDGIELARNVDKGLHPSVYYQKEAQKALGIDW